MTNARELLETYHFDILKDMVALFDIIPSSNHKRAHVNALSPVLFTRQAIEAGLARLSQREKDALAAIQRQNGRTKASRLRLQLLRQGIVDPPQTDRYGYHYAQTPKVAFLPENRRTSYEAVIGMLMATGLICGEGISYTYYSNRSKVHYDNAETLYIPEEVARLLPEPPPVQLVEVLVEDLLRVEESSARAFQRDIYFYWSTARTTPLTLTKDDRLYRRDLRTINDALLSPENVDTGDEPDVPRLIFLRLLLTNLGLLVRQGQTVRGIDHPPFLGLQPAERIQRTFTQWRDGLFWNELLSVKGINLLGTTSRIDPVPGQIAQARACVLGHVTELHRAAVAVRPSLPPEQRWVPIEQLIESLRVADYDFLFPRNYSPANAYYYAYAGYTPYRSPYISYGNQMGWNISPRFENEAEGWEVVEAGFIRAMLLEPLHWMGLVDIGYAGDRPVAYRMTSAGEWILGTGKDLVIPSGEGRVIVQPNFELFAMDPISDLTLAKLDEFADRSTAERAIKYRLTRESVYRAQRNGWTSARIIDTLAQMSDTPLPQNVQRTLQEWQTIHERIKIYRQGSMLQAQDGALLDRLSEDPRIGSRLATRPDRSIAVIAHRPGEIDELVRNLQQVGYPPARTRSAGQPLRPSFTIGEDGQLCFTFALPSIYLYEQIAPFTGQDERQRYYLTRSAVQEAIAGGMGVEDILARLRTLHLGPLPRWIEIKVRAWGRYYGDAAMQTVTLVQLKDEKTLHELLAEPEVEGLLRSFSPDGRKALALVVTDDLDALHKVLEERSIGLKDQLDE